MMQKPNTMGCLFAAPDLKPDVRKIFQDTNWLAGFDGIKNQSHDLLVFSLGVRKDTGEKVDMIAIAPKSATGHIKSIQTIDPGEIMEDVERAVLFHHAKNAKFPGSTWIEFLSNEPLEEVSRRGHIDVKDTDGLKEMLVLYLATGTIEKIQLDDEYGPNGEPPVFNDAPPERAPRASSKPGKTYTPEEMEQVIRPMLAKLGANEERIQKWIKKLSTSPDGNMLVNRLETGQSEFERKPDGEITIVIEMGFGGPMFDNLPDAVKKSLGF
jgi:hypothetical protein